MLQFNEIVTLVSTVTTSVPQVDEKSTPKAILVNAGDIVNVCYELHHNPTAYFDMLSCITGVDNGVESGTMEVIYNLYSIPFNHHVMIKVTLLRENSEVESVCSVWRGANWLEREVYDMFGIKFLNHPDLRRILMPADWKGYPLRKDYKHEETYRDVKIDY
jgi:NADH-quinone oxidoreductase subunit C